MNARMLAPLAAASLVLGSGLAGAQTPTGAEARVTRNAAGPRSSGKGAQSLRTFGDSWVYEATTDVFADSDADGYYRFLRVQFDVDSIFTEAWVYAEIYVSADGTAWELLYSTDDFEVFGSDPEDDYEVETELVSGYSTGLYDVLIEIYDADTGELVDEFGPNESPEFSLVPLEDSGRDGVILPPPVSHDHGGGGAVSWLGLGGLLGAWARRRRRFKAQLS